MKIPAILLSALLLVPSICLAEEANPFVKKKDESKKSEPPAGPEFVGVVEHILVPPDLIDDWLLHNAAPLDATALRAEVQKWVNEGKATLDATVLVTGVGNRACTTEAMLEQIYPTEYSSWGPGVWPGPTAFETRNTGYTQMFRLDSKSSPARISVGDEVVEMTGSNSFHTLVEKTREPDDVFMPVMRTYRARQGNTSQTSNVDPFAEPSDEMKKTWGNGFHYAVDPVFEAGKIAWLAKFDPLPEERKKGMLSRMIFARGDLMENEHGGKQLNEEFITSVVSLKIKQSEFSNWLQTSKLATAPKSAWQFVDGLRESGRVEVVDSLNTRCRKSQDDTYENISEYTYPMEWKPANRETVLDKWEERKPQKVDGADVNGVASYSSLKIESVPGLAGASIPTAFETRNTGRTCELSVVQNDPGNLMGMVLERVSLVGQTVHRRVEHEGKWVPDITNPLFSSQRINTATRLTPGEWQLVGAGLGYNENGKVDRDHAVLTFVKVE